MTSGSCQHNFCCPPSLPLHVLTYSRDFLFYYSGKYLFIETSSPRVSGDRAKLYSSLISARSGAMCFTFWYHMYGSAIGQLKILVQSNWTAGGGTGQQPQQQQVQLKWRLTGNQGNTWHRAAVAVGTAIHPAADNYTVSSFRLNTRNWGHCSRQKSRRRVLCGITCCPSRLGGLACDCCLARNCDVPALAVSNMQLRLVSE